MHLSQFRPRFSVRSLMIAVAIVGLVMEGGILGKRWWEYRSLASRFDGLEREELGHAKDIEEGRSWVSCYAEEFVISRTKALATYHGFLKHKYKYAARYPWLPVEPDPPPPE